MTTRLLALVLLLPLPASAQLPALQSAPELSGAGALNALLLLIGIAAILRGKRQ